MSELTMIARNIGGIQRSVKRDGGRLIFGDEQIDGDVPVKMT